MTDLAPSDNFLKSLKKGQFVLMAYTGNALCSKPEIAILTNISRTGWFTLEVIREDGTTWETNINKHGIDHNKNDTWAKIIAPLSDLETIVKRTNKYRRMANKECLFNHEEMLSVAKFKQECFDAIAAYYKLRS